MSLNQNPSSGTLNQAQTIAKTFFSGLAAGGYTLTSTGGTRFNAFIGSIAVSASENQLMYCPIPGYFKFMTLKIITNASTTDVTFTLRKNLGTPSNGPSVLVGAGLTGLFSDQIHSTSVVLGDSIGWTVNASTTGNLVGQPSIGFFPT